MTQKQHPLEYGDNVYARMSVNGCIVAEFRSTTLMDMAHLQREMRRLTRKVRGLASFYVRNLSRGWSMERPMMLYPDRFSQLAPSRAAVPGLLAGTSYRPRYS